MALVVLSVVVMAMVQLSSAAVYKVGDSAGWTIIGNVDYKQWAATKTFQVGDVVIFQYNPQFHNVMRVTHAMYKACNASTPLATFTTGNDSIKITNHGHHYFFCGVPGHCLAGQKVDINVLRTSQAVAPTPSVLPPPSVRAASVPGPSPSEAASWKILKGTPRKLGLALALFSAFVFGFA